MRINQLKWVLLVLLFALPCHSATMTVDSLSADRQSVDSVSTESDADEMAVRDSLAALDDFVTVSLLISAPLKALYSVFGHATLRMECPTHHLDFIYTFESDTNVGAFMTGVAGKAKAKYVAVPTSTFLNDSREMGREVKQYKLNLTPKEKQELWRLLDEELMAGAYRKFNLLYTNCLSTSIIDVQRCLVGEYFEWGKLRFPQTLKDGDFLRYAVRHSPWAEFLFITFIGSAYESFSDIEHKLMPEMIISMLREARIVNDETGESRFVVTDPGIVLVEDGGKDKGVPISPIMAFGALLALALVITAAERWAGCKKIARIFDILLFTAQAVVGASMLYITFFSELFASNWNWYFIIFLPLPLLIWWCLKGKKAARCWLAYSIILVLFIAATPLLDVLDFPHQLITGTILVRSLSRNREVNHSTKLNIISIFI